LDEFIDKELSDSEIEELSREDNSNSDPSLQELLKNQQETIRELLELTGKESPDEVKRITREFGLKHLEAALSEVTDLMVSSDKDAIRLSAAKFVVGIAMAPSEKDEDMEALFAKLTSPKNKRK
jgi:hypothetical protein